MMIAAKINRKFNSLSVATGVATLCLAAAAWLGARAQYAPIQTPKNFHAAQPKTTAPLNEPIKGIDANTWPALNNPAGSVQPSGNPPPTPAKSETDLNKIPPVGSGP
jgi:hypothetical protein